MLCKEAWIDEETIDDILNIVDPAKSGLIELGFYKDAM